MKADWIAKLSPLRKKPTPAAILVFIGALGLFLMIAGGGSKSTAHQELAPQDNKSMLYATELEAKLTAAIESIEGAGRTRISITLESGEETVYASDERTEGEKRANEKKHVLMNAQNGQQPLIEKVWEPEIRGISVVCQGANNLLVKSQIVETVSVLTGVSTNRISIAKMK